jgi:hypothetical protein
MDRAAYSLLGEPEQVELLYDPGARLIGLRAVGTDVSHAYPVRQQKSSSSLLVSGRAFTRFYGVSTDVARRYSAKMIGNVLAIDLNENRLTRDRRMEVGAAS